MSTLKKVSALTAVAVAISAPTVFAQRDAGAKISGQFGTGFYTRSAPMYRWTPSYVAPPPVLVGRAPVSPAPQVAQVPTARRSFSVEPNSGAVTGQCVVPSAPASGTPSAVRRSFSYEPAPRGY